VLSSGRIQLERVPLVTFADIRLKDLTDHGGAGAIRNDERCQRSIRGPRALT